MGCVDTAAHAELSPSAFQSLLNRVWTPAKHSGDFLDLRLREICAQRLSLGIRERIDERTLFTHDRALRAIADVFAMRAVEGNFCHPMALSRWASPVPPFVRGS
jgi:hypothetical protein